jgi:hypothetical protein
MARFTDEAGIILSLDEKETFDEIDLHFKKPINERPIPKMAKMFIDYGRNNGLTF